MYWDTRDSCHLVLFFSLTEILEESKKKVLYLMYVRLLETEPPQELELRTQHIPKPGLEGRLMTSAKILGQTYLEHRTRLPVR